MKITGILVGSLALSIKIWILDQINTKIVGGILISLFITVLLAYYGYLDNIEYIRKKRTLLSGFSIAFSALSNIISAFSNNNSKKEKRKRKFKSKLVEEIEIEKHGRKQTIYLPYDVEVAKEMLKYKVYLVDKKNEEHDITHPPGITYSISAFHLGGEKIIVKERATGKIIREYDETDIPNFFAFLNNKNDGDNMDNKREDDVEEIEIKS